MVTGYVMELKVGHSEKHKISKGGEGKYIKLNNKYNSGTKNHMIIV